MKIEEEHNYCPRNTCTSNCNSKSCTEQINFKEIKLINKNYRNKKLKNKGKYDNLQRKETNKAKNKIEKLKRQVIVNAKYQEDFSKIKKCILQSKNFKSSCINIEKITCNNKGRITILLKTKNMTDIVIKEIEEIKFKV